MHLAEILAVRVTTLLGPNHTSIFAPDPDTGSLETGAQLF